MSITDREFPCDHGRVCMIECPACTERRERQARLDRLTRSSRLQVIEGDGAQNTSRFRETLAELKQIAADLKEES